MKIFKRVCLGVGLMAGVITSGWCTPESVIEREAEAPTPYQKLQYLKVHVEQHKAILNAEFKMFLKELGALGGIDGTCNILLRAQPPTVWNNVKLLEEDYSVLRNTSFKTIHGEKTLYQGSDKKKVLLRYKDQHRMAHILKKEIKALNVKWKDLLDNPEKKYRPLVLKGTFKLINRIHHFFKTHGDTIKGIEAERRDLLKLLDPRSKHLVLKVEEFDAEREKLEVLRQSYQKAIENVTIVEEVPIEKAAMDTKTNKEKRLRKIPSLELSKLSNSDSNSSIKASRKESSSPKKSFSISPRLKKIISPRRKENVG